MDGEVRGCRATLAFTWTEVLRMVLLPFRRGHWLKGSVASCHLWKVLVSISECSGAQRINRSELSKQSLCSHGNASCNSRKLSSLPWDPFRDEGEEPDAIL